MISKYKFKIWNISIARSMTAFETNSKWDEIVWIIARLGWGKVSNVTKYVQKQIGMKRKITKHKVDAD